MTVEKNTVLIIGAGVIGLQAGINILEAGYKVFIIAEFLPGDTAKTYTSPWAGALWRTHETTFDEAAAWDLETYQAWLQLTKKEEECGKKGESGVACVTMENYWATEQIPELWWKDHVLDFEPMAPGSTMPPNCKSGVTFRSFTISTPTYLNFLLRKVQELGGRVFRTSLPTKQGFASAVRQACEVCHISIEAELYAVVNATGLGARKLLGDESIEPIRGQTVLVRGETTGLRVWIGDSLDDVVAVIPRVGEGLTVIGVTKEPGIWDCSVSEESTKKMLERASWLAPELCGGGKGKWDVVESRVGLRPKRSRGARVELEHMAGLDGIKVVHSYGHAGAGYNNSIGSAKKVLRLLSERTDPET